jgi:hypothetical protein
LKVSKLTTTEALRPIEYYRLPFCRPINRPEMENEYLSSLDLLKLKKGYVLRAVSCRSANGGNGIVDNIPAASKVENDTQGKTRPSGKH